jgi:hypothetical protein
MYVTVTLVAYLRPSETRPGGRVVWPWSYARSGGLRQLGDLKIDQRRYNSNKMISKCCYRVGDSLVLVAVVVDGNRWSWTCWSGQTRYKLAQSGRYMEFVESRLDSMPCHYF